MESATATVNQIAVLPLDQIQVDAARFQFRTRVGRVGTGGRLKAAKRWNHELAGIISVWRDPALDQAFCVNGHHRVALARRMGVAELVVRFIEAATDADARAVGALVNLAEGSGGLIDFAKIFRAQHLKLQDLQAFGINLAADQVQQVAALVMLEPSIFDAVVRGKLPESAGVLIGAVMDPQRQLELLQLRSQLGWSEAILAEACELAQEAIAAEDTGRRQLTLEGCEGPDPTDLTMRLAVRAAVRSRLKSQIRALATASGTTSRRWLEQAGCRVDDVGVRQQRKAAEVLLEGFAARCNQQGSDLNVLLGELAVECSATGETPPTAVSRHWDLLAELMLRR